MDRKERVICSWIPLWSLWRAFLPTNPHLSLPLNCKLSLDIKTISWQTVGSKVSHFSRVPLANYPNTRYYSHWSPLPFPPYPCPSLLPSLPPSLLPSLPTSLPPSLPPSLQDTCNKEEQAACRIIRHRQDIT